MSGKKKILVAEDEMILARSICRELERFGYISLGPVHDAGKVAEIALNEKPDLILMDRDLAGHSGGKEALKQIESKLSVPVVYIADLSDQKALERANVSEPCDYLYKPFREEEIGSTIERALCKHKAQLQIKKNENMLSATLHRIEDAVIASDANLQITCANPAAEKLLGKPETDILGKKLTDVCRFIRSGDRRAIHYPCNKLSDNKEPWHVPEDGLLVNMNDRHIPVRGTVSVIPDEKEEAGGIVIVLRDVTREREKEEKAKIQPGLERISNEIRNRLIKDTSPEIKTILDTKARLVYVSPSVKKMLGYDVKELEGQNAWDFIHDDDRHAVEETFQNIIKESTEEIGVEHRFLHKEGHWVYLESVGSKATMNTSPGGIVITSREITDRKRAENELISARDAAEEMNRAKTALLANMSHEMRTPLTGILGFASILESDLPEGDNREMAMRIHSSGRRLLETIELILDLAKLESEKIELQADKVNIIHEVSRAMEVHAPSAQNKGLGYRLDTNLEKCNVFIDRQLFNRILYNLLSNAFKYTQEGEIVVHIAKWRVEEDLWIQIDVQDTGVGISSDFLPRVFNEFEQESSGYSRKFEGSGLGLTITRKLVESMGGKISVSSEKEKGAVFTIKLPVEEADTEVEPGDHSDPRDQLGRAGQKPGVLLVEDDYDSAIITKFYLAKEYDVDTVDSGEKALIRLRENSYGLVVMDIKLGAGMDGVATLKAIRKNSLLGDLPVIALTAHALSGDAEYYLSEGFSGYIAKPFKKNELMDLARKLVRW